MDLGTLDAEAIEREVRKVFGGRLPWDRKGVMCLVHLDRPGLARRRERVEQFQPTDLFDPSCPHCRAILRTGAFVVFGEDEVVGVNPLPDGRLEIVQMRAPLPLAQAN